MGIKEFFKASVPFLATAASVAGGPIGAIAAGVLTKAVGSEVKPGGIADALQQLSISSEGMVKLKQAEMDFQEQMAKLGYDNEQKLEELAASDRNSARQREMTVRDKVPEILAICVTAGFFGLLTFMMFKAPPLANEKLLDIMLGSLGAAWMSVISYYFGSSASSRNKDNALVASIQNGK